MDNSDMDAESPISEVGCTGQTSEVNRPSEESNAHSLLRSMENLLSRLLAAQQPTTSNSNITQLIKFNPDDNDSDIEGWCRVTEMVVKGKNLKGVDLLLALTNALQGRAATCITKINLDQLDWDTVKETLTAKFSKRVIADQGRCYISSDFKQFCAEHNIDLHFIATGSSRANGQVERVMRTLKSLLTIIENDPHKTWRDELGNVQLALNSTKSTVTKYTPTELMFGIRSQSLGLAKISPESAQNSRLDLDSIRDDASHNIESAARSDTERFNRGRAVVKPFREGDFVFIKSSERNQTKLDRKFKGPFIICRVLENDRYELRSVDGCNRTLKYAHDSLRLVPKGHEGLVEITSSMMNAEGETVTAPDDITSDYEINDTNSVQSYDTMTAGSETLTASSVTDTASSDTLSAESEDDTPALTFDVTVDVHNNEKYISQVSQPLSL